MTIDDSLHPFLQSSVQCLAKLCVDSIDTLVRYLRENIKFSIKSLYFKYDYRWLLHTILQTSVHNANIQIQCL